MASLIHSGWATTNGLGSQVRDLLWKLSGQFIAARVLSRLADAHSTAKISIRHLHSLLTVQFEQHVNYDFRIFKLHFFTLSFIDFS